MALCLSYFCSGVSGGALLTEECEEQEKSKSGGGLGGQTQDRPAGDQHSCPVCDKVLMLLCFEVTYVLNVHISHVSYFNPKHDLFLNPNQTEGEN